MKVWNEILSFIKENMWIVHIILGIFTLLGIHFIIKRFIKIIGKKRSWKENVEESILKPIYFILWTIGIFYIINVFAVFFKYVEITTYSRRIRDAVIIITICYFVLKWKSVFPSFFFKKISKKMDSATSDFLGKLFSFIIIFIGFLLILQVLGVNIMPIIAFGGVGAAAIGFAAKDVIANFFGGFMIHITRPFSKGDYIEIPKENILGTIKKIGWYLTCVVDLDHCPIYLPNSIFAISQIKNKTRRTNKKIQETISIRYDDFSKIKLIISDIESLLKKEEKIDHNLDILVSFTAFNDYSLDLIVRGYTEVISYKDFMHLRQELLIEIGNIISKHGAEIPFPTNSIKMEK